MCGVGAKPVAHLMQYHLLQKVAKIKPLMNSNMTLSMLYLHQKTPKSATTKIQVKRYERYKRDEVVSGRFLDVDPCLSLDSPFLDLSGLEDLYQYLHSINPTTIIIISPYRKKMASDMQD